MRLFFTSRRCAKPLALSLALAFTAAHASAQAARFEYREVHMGMPVRIVMHAATDSIARIAARAAFKRIAELDSDLSDYRSNSELRRIERNARNWVTVKPTTFAVLQRSIEIAQASDGAFDPTIGPLVRLWRTARQNRKLPSTQSIRTASKLVSYRYLELDSSRFAVRLSKRGMQLDLGGIAKGYILDQAMRVLRERAPSAMIEAGGDIRVGLSPPESPGWRIQVPGADSAFARQAAALQNAALATSGSTAQFVEIGGLRYSHVIDPRTGRALTSNVIANVIARDGATADAVATALTILAPDKRPAFLARQPVIATSIH